MSRAEDLLKITETKTDEAKVRSEDDSKGRLKNLMAKDGLLSQVERMQKEADKAGMNTSGFEGLKMGLKSIKDSLEFLKLI